MWLGETGENTDAWIAKFRAVLDQNQIGWCFWPYKKLDATTCVTSITLPDDWAAIVAYAEARGGGDRDKLPKLIPSLATSRRALEQLLQNIRLEKCRINEGYLRALGLSRADKS